MAEPGADAGAGPDGRSSSSDGAAASPAAGEARTTRSPASSEDRSKRRLDQIFGDVLPEVTRDELAGDLDGAGRSDETGTARDAAGRDADLLRDVPPHHHHR